MIQLTAPDAIGTLGVILIIGSYLFLQLDYLSGKSVSYSVLNAIGAACVLISLFYFFNLSAFIVEFFWLIISLIGIIRNIRLRQKQA